MDLTKIFMYYVGYAITIILKKFVLQRTKILILIIENRFLKLL